MRKWVPLCLAILPALAATAEANNLVSVHKNGALSPANFNTRAKAAIGDIHLATQTTEFYKIRYRSVDAKGRPAVLSGLLVLPHGGAPRGLIVFDHGTISHREAAPSRYTGAAKSSEEQAATLAFASGGYAIAMPDYPGLGDDKGIHPFPMARLSSPSSVDLIAPARAAAQQLHITVGRPLFITGYSEGGAIAMWTVRTLEQSPAMAAQLTASAPLSGPYDLSDVTPRSLLAPSANATVFAGRLYLMAYLMHTAYKNRGVKLTDYLAPAMALVVSRVFDRGLTDEVIVKRLVVTATLLRAKNSMDRLTTPRLREALRKTDPADPIMRELLENNCYDWSPRARMLLVCLQSDPLVTAENTHETLRAMRGRGVSLLTVQEHTLTSPTLTHITAIVPALLQARRFFDERGQTLSRTNPPQ
ncbi:hypothetical protein CCAX7_10840 [Capsulimonas corticalis]|uniref:Uncharacterized protein n=1 Tax=Capsulimonas corticalis TaxID=2219043 RepID=A0A402CUK4_9BACT|nr:alpha/beta fold hydrolase [Capsulimonas corticalis]BDI29033.1 hypothetical protein CCAX7_10840 [Capsulimonas corticalis]